MCVPREHSLGYCAGARKNQCLNFRPAHPPWCWWELHPFPTPPRRDAGLRWYPRAPSPKAKRWAGAAAVELGGANASPRVPAD